MPDSSPETEVKAGAAPDVVQDVKEAPAESSTAGEQGQKGDMLTAVKAALAPKEKSPDSATEGLKPEAKPESAPEEQEEEGDGSEDLTEEELTRLNAKTRKRISKLLSLRDERDREIGELKPLAEKHQQLVQYLTTAGVTLEEANVGFEVMRDLKNYPLKAYERLKPIFEQLQQMVGVSPVLPEDLQSEVAMGRITEAHAREMARSRAVATVSQQTLERQQQQDQQRRQAEQTQAHVDAVSASVTEWEKTKAKSDPDWKLKQARVTELVQLDLYKRQAEGKPFPTKDEAIGMSDAALAKVNEDFKKLAPKPRAITPVTEVASTRSSPVPATLLEAARLGAARARAG